MLRRIWFACKESGQAIIIGQEYKASCVKTMLKDFTLPTRQVYLPPADRLLALFKIDIASTRVSN